MAKPAQRWAVAAPGRPFPVLLPAARSVVADEAGVVGHFASMARDNHQFARFNKIGLDQRGDPRPGDLHLAWAAGARVALLTPR